jgi:hypothetical protein
LTTALRGTLRAMARPLIMGIADEMARKRRIPNLLDYADGAALSRYLRHNDYPQPAAQQGGPIMIPERPRRQRRGPLAY